MIVRFSGALDLQEIAGHPVWRQTSHPSCRSSLVVSRGDWAETCGLETPVMKMMRGIDDHPKNDADDGERKSSTDGCPTPSRHCWTRHVYASWHHQRNLDGPARSLSGRCCGRHGVTTDVSETRDVFPRPVFACVQASSTCGGPTRGSWAVPPP